MNDQLRSLKQLHGAKLGATDGEIGHVRDVYFDDRTWAVRYLVADTGNWLPGRQVLLAPPALADWDETGGVLNVNLSRRQIEKSPAMAEHLPLSRQYEEDYYRYYGWPSYWQGEGVWDAGTFPVVGQPPTAAGTARNRPEAHLRSTAAVTGYQVRGVDGTQGQISDFLLAAEEWTLASLVIRIGHRFSGAEVILPTGAVERISYEDSTVYVSLTMAAIGLCPPRHGAPPLPRTLELLHQVADL